MSFSPIGAGMAAIHVFFSHRSRDGGNACFMSLCSPVFVGEGGDRCKRSRVRAIMAAY